MRNKWGDRVVNTVLYMLSRCELHDGLGTFDTGSSHGEWECGVFHESFILWAIKLSTATEPRYMTAL